MRDRKTRWGYTNMGRPRVPPLPQFIVIEGRDDGEHYLLTHDGAGNLTLSTTLPTKPDVVYYGPYAGPYIQDGAQTVRLYVEAGALEGEYSGFRIWQQRVLARRQNTRDFLEVVVPGGWSPGDPLAVVEVSV